MERLFGTLQIIFQLIVVKLASILLQTAADISSSSQNPMISPAVLVSLYTLSSLLAILALIMDARKTPIVIGDRRENVSVEVDGVGNAESNAFVAPQRAVPDRP